jgi:antitoxin YefM
MEETFLAGRKKIFEEHVSLPYNNKVQEIVPNSWRTQSMFALNYSHFRSHMKETLDRISDEYETATITRKDGKNIILMSEDTYNNLITSIATMGNKANYDWLMASKEQLDEGKAVSHPLESEGKK